MSNILSEQEIFQLTAPIRQRAAQARKLSALLGCPIKRRPDGLPIVTRQMLVMMRERAAYALAAKIAPYSEVLSPAWEDTPLAAWQRENTGLVLPPLARPSEAEVERRQAARRLARAALVRHHEAKRRAAKLRRTPPWANMKAIRSVYLEAQRITRETGVPHHVDHRIPLQGRAVSGLHTHDNLQILTGSENSRKKNHFEVEA